MENITISGNNSLESSVEGIAKLIEKLQQLGKTSESETKAAQTLVDTYGKQYESMVTGVKAFGGAMDASISIINAYNSAATLLGVSQEELADTQRKVQLLQYAGQAVTMVGTVLDQKNALMKGILAVQTWAATRAEAARIAASQLGIVTTVEQTTATGAQAGATEVQAGATGKATIAQTIFNAVAKANPIGLVVIAVMALVAGLVALSKAFSSASKEQQESKLSSDALNRAYENSATGIGDQMAELKSLQEEWAALGNNLKAQEQFLINNKDRMDSLGIAVGNVGQAENLFVDKTDDYIKAMELRAQADAIFEEAKKEYAEAAKNRAKAVSDELTAWQKFKAWGDNGVLAKKYVKENQDAASELATVHTNAANRLLGIHREYNEKANTILREAGMTQTTEAEKQAKARADTLLKAEKEASLKLTELYLSSQKERFLQVANDKKADTVTRLEASRKAYDKELALIRLATSDALKAEGVGPVQKALILAEAYDKEAAELIKQNERVKAIVEEGVNMRLAAIKRGADLMAVSQSECEMEELRAISEQYAKGLTNLEQYEKDKAAIKRKYAVLALEEDIKSIKDQLAEQNLLPEKKQELDDALFKKQAELRMLNQANAIEDNEKLRAQQDKDNDDQVKQQEEKNKKLLDADQAEIKVKKEMLTEQMQDEQQALSEQYSNGFMRKDDYEKSKAEITRKYAQDNLNLEIDSLNSQIASTEENSEQRKELQEQLNAKMGELRQMDLDNAVLKNEEEAAKRKEVMDAIKSGTQELFNSISDSIFEGQKAALQQQLDDLDKYYTTDAEKAKENGNLKLISEEELEKKKKDIKQQQAQVDKNQAIFKATIGALTSAAQVAWNLPLAAIVLAFGMAQVAMIAAKPLPKLWKGRSGGPGQMAMVGEQGPEVVYVPQGASVVPAHQSRVLKEAARIAERYRMPNPAAGLALTKEAAAAGKLTLALPGATMDYDRLGRTIAQNIPKADQVSINMDENGFTKHLTRGNSRVRVLGGRY